MTKSLKQLCDEIEAGYAAEKCMYDMPSLAEELTSRTSEIKQLICLADKLAGVDGNVTVIQGVVWFEDGTTLDIQ